MRRMFVVVLFLVSLPLSAQDTGSFRFIIHTTPQLGEKTKMAAWVIFPNLSRKPDKQLVILGPRFEGKTWWFEPMAGTFIEKGKMTPLLDFRARRAYGRFSTFVLVQWVDPGSGDVDIAPNVEFDYAVSKALSVGIETDDEFLPGPDTLSVGPHVGIVLNRQMFMAVAYQFHQNSGNQLWVRLVWKPATD